VKKFQNNHISAFTSSHLPKNVHIFFKHKIVIFVLT